MTHFSCVMSTLTELRFLSNCQNDSEPISCLLGKSRRELHHEQEATAYEDQQVALRYAAAHPVTACPSLAATNSMPMIKKKKSQIKTTSLPCLRPSNGFNKLFKNLHASRVHTPLEMQCGRKLQADGQTDRRMRGLMVRRKPHAGILTQKSTCFAGKCDKYSARPPLAAPPGGPSACVEGPHLWGCSSQSGQRVQWPHTATVKKSNLLFVFHFNASPMFILCPNQVYTLPSEPLLFKEQQ